MAVIWKEAYQNCFQGRRFSLKFSLSKVVYFKFLPHSLSILLLLLIKSLAALTHHLLGILDLLLHALRDSQLVELARQERLCGAVLIQQGDRFHFRTENDLLVGLEPVHLHGAVRQPQANGGSSTEPRSEIRKTRKLVAFLRCRCCSRLEYQLERSRYGNDYLEQMLIHVFAEVVDERDLLLDCLREVILGEEALLELFVQVLHVVRIRVQHRSCGVVEQNSD